MQLSSLSRSQTSYDFLLTSTDVLHHWVSGDSWELLLSLLSLSNISFPQNIIFPRVRPWITLLYSLCMFLFFGWCGQTCVNGKLSPSLRLQSISNLLVKHRLTILIRVWPQPKSTHERKLLKKNGIHHKSSKYFVSSFLVCVQPNPLPQKKK